MERAERDVRRMEGIICSMTPLERRKPELLKATRKRRIAAGAGVQVQEVNRLLNQFEQMRDMMKKMKGGGMMKMMKRMGGMKGLGGHALSAPGRVHRIASASDAARPRHRIRDRCWPRRLPLVWWLARAARRAARRQPTGTGSTR